MINKKKKTVKFPFRVRVTPKHIKDGLPWSSRSCPVALAFKSGTRREWAVGRIIAARDDGKYYVDLPTKVSDFIVKFDTGEPVKPFSFTVHKRKVNVK